MKNFYITLIGMSLSFGSILFAADDESGNVKLLTVDHSMEPGSRVR